MKLWGGRFSEGLDTLAAQLNNSLPFDWRLGEVDVKGSMAWAQAIEKAGILTSEETVEILEGLDKILEEVNNETFEMLDADEDIHTAVERRLTELIGPVGGKLHTGRSRNDQVATDFRMWVLEAIDQVIVCIENLQQCLVERAEKDTGIILPGYTHFQRAQPILLSHWWLSHFWPLARDRQRLVELRSRTAVLPLGSGALAGVPFNVDRAFLAKKLGFEAVSANSLDAISDRDFATEFVFDASMVGLHLSRMAEALILYSTAEYGFVEMSDAYSTGSSLMPQKKNADTLELTRGKAGTLIGKLTGLMAMLKGLPSAYDKDLQEDKLPVFEAAETLLVMVPVMTGALATLTVHEDRIRTALDPALLATDLADYLVNKGVPFRSAHKLVGQAVRMAIEKGTSLEQLTLTDYQQIDPVFEKDVKDVFNFEKSVSRRKATGGTAPEAVLTQLEQAKDLLSSYLV